MADDRGGNGQRFKPSILYQVQEQAVEQRNQQAAQAQAGQIDQEELDKSGPLGLFAGFRVDPKAVKNVGLTPK